MAVLCEHLPRKLLGAKSTLKPSDLRQRGGLGPVESKAQALSQQKKGPCKHNAKAVRYNIMSYLLCSCIIQPAINIDPTFEAALSGM